LFTALCSLAGLTDLAWAQSTQTTQNDTGRQVLLWANRWQYDLEETETPFCGGTQIVRTWVSQLAQYGPTDVPVGVLKKKQERTVCSHGFTSFTDWWNWSGTGRGRSGIWDGNNVTGQDPGNPDWPLQWWGQALGDIHTKSQFGQTETHKHSLYTEIKIRHVYPPGTPQAARAIKVTIK